MRHTTLTVKIRPSVRAWRDSKNNQAQALADISRSALYCHSNETRAPIANLPNSAQLEGTRYHSPSYIPVRAVVWECGDAQTDAHIS